MADGIIMGIRGKRTMSGRLATAQIGIVDDVVMHQRAGLKHFDRACQIQHRIHITFRHILRRERTERIQRQQRPQTFAALT